MQLTTHCPAVLQLHGSSPPIMEHILGNEGRGKKINEESREKTASADVDNRFTT